LDEFQPASATKLPPAESAEFSSYLIDILPKSPRKPPITLQVALTRFQLKLGELELDINRRNDNKPPGFAYDILLPSAIPISINV